MSQYYSDPSREHDKWSLPDLEVFYVKAGQWDDSDGDPLAAGWYYWFCLPGCMPDSDPEGPFSTEDEALTYARRQVEE